MPRCRRRPALLALGLALAIPGTPIARSFPSACDRCPSTCPMHQKGKLRCHRAPGVRAEPGCHRSIAGLAAPGCGQRPELPTAAVAPAVLPGAVHVSAVPTSAALHPSSGLRPGRAADPPDTPPPISA